MLALVTVLAFGVNIYVRLKTKNSIISVDEAKKLEDVDCILVLGASVKNGNKPSLMLSDRLKKSVEAYEAGVAPKLLMSGDHSSVYYDEVNAMKKYAVERGIPSGDVFMDHAGFSTYESMYRAKEIFKARKIVIITQEYHLYRALYIADRLGLEAYGIAASGQNYVGQVKRDIREFFAIDKDFFKVIVKPEPSMLGSAIPITGDGDVTND